MNLKREIILKSFNNDGFFTELRKEDRISTKTGYNWERPHDSLGGKSPMNKYFELSNITPFWMIFMMHMSPIKNESKIRIIT